MSKSNKKNNQLDRAYQSLFQADLKSIRDGARSSLSTVAHDYLNQLVDCSTGKSVGCPSLIGGVPGRTQIVREKAEFDVEIGVQGFGFLGCNLSNSGFSAISPTTGPFNDTPNFMFTTSTWNDTNLPRATTALPPGVVARSFDASPRELGTVLATHDQHTYLNWRPVAMLAKVTNISAVLTQNGALTAWSPPNNQSCNGLSSPDFSLFKVESLRGARVVRAQNDASIKDHLILNWHPHGAMSNVVPGSMNDFMFTYSGMSIGTSGPYTNNMTDIKDGLLVFRGTPGQTFHISISVIYEMKGTAARSAKPRLTDSRGMDLVYNVLASKSLSGYVGDPRHVADGYLAKAWELSKKLVPKAVGFIKEHEKAIMDRTGRFLKDIAGLE